MGDLSILVCPCRCTLVAWPPGRLAILFVLDDWMFIPAGVLLLGLLAGLWLGFAPGPRRERAYRRARRWLQAGDWQQALNIAHGLGQLGRLPAAWQGRLRSLEGECHRLAGEQALRAKQYEDAQRHHLAGTPLLGSDPEEVRGRVLAAALADVRRLFAAGVGDKENAATQELIARLLLLHTPIPEASFWQGLGHLRAGHTDFALASLTTAAGGGGRTFIDPPLYLGVILLREGRAQEALRHLSDANRIDGDCPLVPLQVGMALLAAGGDCGMAARALQRALGPRGLGQWVKTPERLWVDGFPEGRSFVRRLATDHPFVCPVFGGDVAALIRQGQVALAQAYTRAGNHAESANVYSKLLQESAPTPALLQGLGIALARQERYDEAYKHLRIAHDMEESRDRVTAGYLALCGAMGKPSRPEDKPKNVAWAVRLLGRFEALGDPEWARLCSAVFAEARAAGVPLALEDQRRLADVLVSVHATDPAAAAAFAQLAATAPEALLPQYAWLYARAAQQHDFHSDQDLALFGLLFRDPEAARAFYAERGWDFEEMVFTFLERSAALRPGRFPEELGSNYAAQGEDLLLERSRRQDEAGQGDAALATGLVLLKLLPRSGRGHDWVARLYYRRGDFDQAALLLARWSTLEPSNPVPLQRLAVVEQRRGNVAGRKESVADALRLTSGATRAAVALLGARLALADVYTAGDEGSPATNGQASANHTLPAPVDADRLHEAASLLKECLKEDEGHVEALLRLAAVHAALGDHEALAAQARSMDRPDVHDARFHYLAAVCHLAAGDHVRVLTACERAAGDPALALECQYLRGLAHLRRNDHLAAAAFAEVAASSSPSADHARAQLGRLRFEAGKYQEAVEDWRRVAPHLRAAWNFDDALRGTVFLTALQGFEEGRYEQAADKVREAGRLGLRDRRLGPLLALALTRAGQRLLYEHI